MANWCKNELTVSGNGVELIKEKYVDGYNFDFNSIIKVKGNEEATEK